MKCEIKKTWFMIFILLILFSQIVIAGNTYPLDFSKSNNYLIHLRENDRIEFNLNNERHTIIIREIIGDMVGITCFLNLNTQNIPLYFTIGKTLDGKDTKLKLDTDRNDVDDLYLWLESIENKKIGLRIFKPINNEITGDAVVDVKKTNYKWVIFPLIAVILLILIVIFKRRT